MNKIEKTLGVGVIGCAGIAEKYMFAAIKSNKNMRLTAIASRSKEKAEKFADLFGGKPVLGYENIFNEKNIDVIYIPLPPGLHEKWTIESLKEGKHVLCEKPLTIDCEATERVVNEARKQGLLVQENYMFIKHPQHAYVKKIIESGEIGEVRLFRGLFGFPPRPKDDIRYDKRLGGGALLDAGGYPIRAARYFLGDSIEGCGADLVYDKSKDVDIYGSAMFRNNAGLSAHVSFGFDNDYRCNYMIWGSRGTIFVDRAYSTPPHMEPEIVIEKKGNRKSIKLPAANHFELALDDFCEVILSGGDYGRHYDSVLEQARLIEYIRKSGAPGGEKG